VVWYNKHIPTENSMNKFEILKIGQIHQVWSYNGTVCFEGSFADCEDYIACFEEDEENEND
jgi:hypothetical protein